MGFQHGRCLICGDVLALGDAVAVDHVFPFSLMHRFSGVRSWHGPDLDALWNLAPAHARCNAAKSDRLPTPGELARLTARNEAIRPSPTHCAAPCSVPSPGRQRPHGRHF
ncbi:hypothetical protein [Streptomyces sp. NPDC054834]